MPQHPHPDVASTLKRETLESAYRGLYADAVMHQALAARQVTAGKTSSTQRLTDRQR